MRASRTASIAVVLTAVGAALVGLMALLYMRSLPQKRHYLPLLNGYGVYISHATDINIAQGGPEGGNVVVRGIVTEVGLAPNKGIIVGINKPQYEGLTYFVLDTNKHRVDTGLSLNQCRQLLRERHGMELPELQRISLVGNEGRVSKR